MKKALTILHVDTERGWRGGERQLLWLASDLAAKGHRSIVAARPGEPLTAAAIERNLQVFSFSPRGEADILAALRLRNFIRAEHVDVLHAHTAHAVAFGALGTIGTSVPMVITRRVDFRLRSNPFSRWIYGRAKATIAISSAVAEALVASGIPRSRIEIVHSGIDLSRTVQPATAARLASLGVRGGPLVVQVAAFVPHKDPVTFVRAMAVVRDKIPSVQALMLGEGPLRGDVERARRELSLEDVVHAPGHVPDAESILVAADVATLSSREEGLGTTLLDALAFGIPVAACAGGGISESIVDGQTGLTAPVGDSQGLGRAIIRLLEDRPLASRLATAGRARVTEMFSMDRTSRETLGVYERTLKRNHGVGTDRTDG
ncbi:MAG: glycosyltransferase family 4 protein [Gemmatimonadaceae bacterium]